MPGFLLMKSLGVSSRDVECGSLVMSKAPQRGQKVRILGFILSSRKGGKLKAEFNLLF